MRFALPDPGEEITLRAAGSSCGIVAGLGARLTHWQIGARQILRPLTDHGRARGFAYGFSGFPLMPYSGPIFGGGIHWEGKFRPLARNVSMEADATHGEGWILPWTVLRRADDALSLGVEWCPREHAFPFRWTGEMTYRITANSLTVDMRLTNRDHRTMPAGMGFHPYFTRTHGSRLRFDHTGIWPYDGPERVSEGAGPAPPGLDFREGQDVGWMSFDRCFEGWGGTARLETPGLGAVTISASEAFGKLQCFAPFYDNYICMEPVTNANDGANRQHMGVSGHGIVALAPGRSLTGVIRMEMS